MKTIFYPTILMILLSFFIGITIGWSQPTTKIWVTIENQDLVPTEENGILTSAQEEMNQLIQQYELKTCVQALPASRNQSLQQVYEITADGDQDGLIEQLNRTQGFQQAEPAPTYEALYTPNDYNMAFSEDYALELIEAESAWDISMGDTAVDIAITDTNYDLDHQELMGTVSYLQSGISHPSYYHGTAVAITAAGNTDNEVGKSSIGSDCELQLYAMNYNSILEATYNGARVVNVSWTSGCFYSSYYQNVIDEVVGNGTIVVAAAGNGSTCGGASNYVYPASFEHVISVSSVGPSDNHERIIGDPSSTHQHNDSVDICAPGYDVALTVQEGWYLTGNGTSFAAPYVSGTIGLMLSVNPCLTLSEVEMILKETADDIDSVNPTYAGGLGAGRLNASKAVLMASEFQNFELSLEASYDCDSYLGTIAPLEMDESAIKPYEYAWTNGSTDPFITDLESGEYGVEITDSLGCKSFETITLNIPDPLEVEQSSSAPLCFGTADGAIDLSPSNGVAPYSFEWSGGELTEDRTALTAGFYSCEITDADGCVVLTEVELIAPEAVQIQGELTHDGLGNGEGAIDLTVLGGTPGYAFDWSNGSMTEDLEDLEAGSYEVLVIDGNGCEEGAFFTLTGAVLSIDSEEGKVTGVYPNPVQQGGIITVQLNEIDQEYSILLLDMLGKLVYQESITTGEEKLQIQLPNLPSGAYQISIQAKENTLSTERLIVR